MELEDLTIEQKKTILNESSEEGKEPYLLVGFDGGLVGWMQDEDVDYIHAVYDYRLCISYYAATNECSEEDAIEWWDFNVARSLPYIEEKRRPVVINLF